MVLRAQGADPARLRARSSAAVAVAEQALELGLPLLQPAVAYRSIPVIGLRHERLLLHGGAFLSGPLVAAQLHAACEVAVLVCTIGPVLEQRASRCFANDPALSVALDGLGSAAVDLLAATACRWVDTQASERGIQTTVPLSPGLLGWPVASGQREIFTLVPAAEAGILLNAGSMIIPHKSTSLVIGIGPDVLHEGDTCDFCSLRERCTFRQEHRHAHG